MTCKVQFAALEENVANQSFVPVIDISRHQDAGRIDTMPEPPSRAVTPAAKRTQEDRIRRFGQNWIYDESDLMRAVLEGTPGDMITLEVERDGAVFHVTVPRGPLGITQTARMLTYQQALAAALPAPRNFRS